MSEKTAVLKIYQDGSIDYVPMPVGELRRLGQHIMQLADNVMLPGTGSPNGSRPEGAKAAPAAE